MELNVDIMKTLGFSKNDGIWKKNGMLIGEPVPNKFTFDIGSRYIQITDVEQLNNLWLGINDKENPLPIDKVFLDLLKNSVDSYLDDSENLINLVGIIPESVKFHYDILIGIRTNLQYLMYKLNDNKK